MSLEGWMPGKLCVCVGGGGGGGTIALSVLEHGTVNVLASTCSKTVVDVGY